MVRTESQRRQREIENAKPVIEKAKKAFVEFKLKEMHKFLSSRKVWGYVYETALNELKNELSPEDFEKVVNRISWEGGTERFLAPKKWRRFKYGTHDNQKLFNIVKPIIDKWDPAELLKSGAPPDEYEMEIGEIAYLLRKTESVGKLAKELFEICFKSFGRREAYRKYAEETEYKEFIEIAEKLFIAVYGITETFTKSK